MRIQRQLWFCLLFRFVFNNQESSFLDVERGLIQEGGVKIGKSRWFWMGMYESNFLNLCIVPGTYAYPSTTTTRSKLAIIKSE